MSKASKGRNTFGTNEPIFEQLENYLNFCRDYGYRYDERDLTNMRSYAFQQYQKFLKGKNFKNIWEEDLKKMEAEF